MALIVHARNPSTNWTKCLGSQSTYTVGIGYPTIGSSSVGLRTKFTQKPTSLLPSPNSIACSIVPSILLSIV